MDRRIGISAIPSDPKSYLNEQQQLGLIHLREYGWTTFCVRRPSVESVTTILKNKYNNKLGILSEEGTLRVVDYIRVRDCRYDEANNIEKMVDSMKQQINSIR
jgi:hypothetical protein